MTKAAIFPIAAGGLGILVASYLAVSLSMVSELFVLGAAVPYVVGAAIVMARIGRFHPYPRFGAANTVTLLRMSLTCLLAGFVLDITAHDMAISDGLAWMFCGMTALNLLLDGIDGALARGQGLTSAFGARFDMEVDAFQILLLSAAAYALDKAGGWILIGGLLRYIYVAVGVLIPALTAPLLPAFRRKAVAVIQAGTLTALLAPIVTPPLSTAAAAIALALLIYSFAVDVIWLLRKDRTPYSPGA